MIQSHITDLSLDSSFKWRSCCVPVRPSNLRHRDEVINISVDWSFNSPNESERGILLTSDAKIGKSLIHMFDP